MGQNKFLKIKKKMKNYLSPMDIDAYIMSAEENFSGAGGGYYGTDGVDNYYGFNAQVPYMGTNSGVSFAPNGYGGFVQKSNGIDLGIYGADASTLVDAGQVAPQVMAQPVAPAKTPTPYQVNVVNTTPNPLTCVLFGMNTYLLTANFGTSVGVTVAPAQVNVSYLELLQQSAMQPFETSLIRIQTSSASQLTQILTVTSKDANGQLLQIPIITQSYFSANQFQSTILDVPYPVKIDGTTAISFTILGNTTATYTFFPAEKVNHTRVLGGASPQQLYGAPQVPLAVPMFTSRPVGISGQTMINPANR
ncbi:MAG TPA: hypothetical protein VN026_00130 [Bacteroidia bacterium]|jgi:hypothetical protein|nr:hypothetical protein [Bacteroidia bacterium]